MKYSDPCRADGRGPMGSARPAHGRNVNMRNYRPNRSTEGVNDGFSVFSVGEFAKSRG